MIMRILRQRLLLNHTEPNTSIFLLLLFTNKCHREASPVCVTSSSLICEKSNALDILKEKVTLGTKYVNCFNKLTG